MLRAHRMIQPLTYQFGEFRLDRSARELSRNGEPVAVPTRVFDCLVYLIENRERAIGRDELVAALWGRVDVSDAQLGQIVLRARRAVGDDGNDQRCIRTMPKYGYRWMAETQVCASETTAASPPVIERPSPDVALPPRATPRRRWPTGLALALIACIAAFAAWRMQDTSAPVADNAPAGGLAVLPVDVTAGADQDWVRLGGMDALASRLRAAGLRVLCAGIALPNDASEGLHRALGFEDVGVYRRIGWKGGRWHDVRWLQLHLGDDAPPATVQG